MYNTDLVGVVLAGGRSSRMGMDKGLIKYHDKEQRYYIADILSAFLKKVIISVPSDFDIPKGSKYNFIKDIHTNLGPISGLHAMYHAFPSNSFLLVATDMPKINREAVSKLLNNRNKNFIATCYKDKDDFVNPLFAIWEKEAAPYIYEAIKNNDYSLSKILKTHTSNILNITDDSILSNINTPLQYKNYKEMTSNKHEDKM